MASLKTKIEKYMGREVNFPFEVALQDDGKGVYIAEWNIEEKTKPTDAQLKAVESNADKEEKNQVAIDSRKSEYGSLESQIEYITENGIDKWKEKVDAIKKKYPKES